MFRHVSETECFISTQKQFCDTVKYQDHQNLSPKYSSFIILIHTTRLQKYAIKIIAPDIQIWMIFENQHNAFPEMSIFTAYKLRNFFWKSNWDVYCRNLETTDHVNPCYIRALCLVILGHIEAVTKEPTFRRWLFKCIFLNEDIWISINISLKFVPKSQVNNISAFAVQVTKHHLIQWWLVYWGKFASFCQCPIIMRPSADTVLNIKSICLSLFYILFGY